MKPVSQVFSLEIYHRPTSAQATLCPRYDLQRNKAEIYQIRSQLQHVVLYVKVDTYQWKVPPINAAKAASSNGAINERISVSSFTPSDLYPLTCDQIRDYLSTFHIDGDQHKKSASLSKYNAKTYVVDLAIRIMKLIIRQILADD